MTAQKMSAQEIIAFIGNAEKKTNVKVTFEGELATAVPASVTKLGNVLFGGEGLFNTVVYGPGTVILQSMPIASTAMQLYQYMPHPSNN